MDKFDSKKDEKLIKNLPFSYFSTEISLDFGAYVLERNGERIVVSQDILYPHEFPALFLPVNKNNWVTCSVTFTTEEDRARIREEGITIIIEKSIGSEFLYNTEDFLNPKGDFKNRVNRFSSGYDFKLKSTYSKEAAIAFYNFWKDQRKHESITFEHSEEFFMFCLENLERYDVQQVYVEIDQKLVGFAWGIRSGNNWVGLHMKVDYQYKGLSRFLHSERAKLFPECPKFTLGTGSHDPGVQNHKEDLDPSEVIKYSYILTDIKK